MKILVTDDDSQSRKAIALFLESEGYRVTQAEDGEAAWGRLQDESFDLLLTDVKMPRLDGLGLFHRLKDGGMPVPVMIMTAFANVEDAVTAMRDGAEDYLTKPIHLDELALKIAKMKEKRRLEQENARLRARLDQLEFPELVGVSEPMKRLREGIARIARDPDVSVMVYGESGTGKELVARAIHRAGARRDRPFLAVHCGSLAESLLESELFGHVKGAFTGALSDKPGLFKAADGGTLFLDEVEDMSPAMQSKLLRVLQDRIVLSVGSAKPVAVDVRIIGASNQDLADWVQKERFRQDLYYRLQVVELTLPPLRQRREDVPLFLHHFTRQFQQQRSRPLEFAPEAQAALREYNWPGNVRELENLVRMLGVTCDGDRVRQTDLPERFYAAAKSTGPEFSEALDYRSALRQVVQGFEKTYLARQLERHQGNVTKTAQCIGLSRVALHQKIKAHDLSGWVGPVSE